MTLASNALIAGVAAAAFLAGAAVGNRTTLNSMIQLISVETQGNLAQRVEALARLRTGDVAGAIADLESAVDTATLALPQGKAWSDLQPGVRSALQLAKAYRTRIPASPPNPQLSAVLDAIPMPEVDYCSPALQKLLRSGGHE